MADIFFNTACKELKIAQIAQLNQLFQLLHLSHIYGHGFYEVSGMLMRKNVNNGVRKDSPLPVSFKYFVLILSKWRTNICCYSKKVLQFVLKRVCRTLWEEKSSVFDEKLFFFFLYCTLTSLSVCPSGRIRFRQNVVISHSYFSPAPILTLIFHLLIFSRGD